jgi:2-succinyl-6-hydroxy-2,4-cyclohexadiene-1-carboxylate synthase
MAEINWHYYQQGQSDGIPLIFLHGFMGNGKIWLPIMQNLTENFYSIAVDLPGHGQTEADISEIDFDILSEKLIGLIDEQELDRPVIIGYSMGGRIALYTALGFPDKFRGMIIESASPGIENEDERYQRLINDRKIAEKLRISDMRTFLSVWYRQPVFEYLAENIKNKIIEKKVTGNPRELADAFERFSQGIQPSLWNDMHHWHRPTLLLAGENDQKYVEILRRMALEMPSAQVKIIKNAGHIIHLENRADFLSALKSFLGSYIL